MPRFADKPSQFTVETEWQGEPVSLTVRWTPATDDEFTCLFGAGEEGGRMTVPEAGVYALLCRQTVAWEGVLDAEGEAIPYSVERLRALFPAVLKVRLIQRFIDRALTFQVETTANPT